MFDFDATPPLSLYIHLPWCVRKCPYCDFNSYELKASLAEQGYVQALIGDLAWEGRRCDGRTVDSIFFGGGTPSLFSAGAVADVLEAAARHLRLAGDAEITLEANPGTFDEARFAGFRRAGVNRLSLGVQSFDDARLGAIGRIHSGGEAQRAFHGARAAGFDNINVDLMYGLPDQTVEQAVDDLRAALRLQPEHISHYQLTLEPQTPFYHRRPALPDEEAQWAMQVRCQTLLAAAGYAQYEVSAYARPGRQCRHNLNYWRFGDYLGVGAGAHGKLTDMDRRAIQRTWKVKHPNQYAQRAGTDRGAAGCQALAPRDAAFEFLLNALRLVEGFDVSLFQRHTGMAPAVIYGGLARARDQGLLQWDERRVLPTAQGRRYLNDLLEIFLPEPA